MKKINTTIYLTLALLLFPSLSSIYANNRPIGVVKKFEVQSQTSTGTQNKIENQIQSKINAGVGKTESVRERLNIRAEQVQLRLEEKESRLNQIRSRIASSSINRTGEKLDKTLAKQEEKIIQARKRLANTEIQVIDVLSKIFGKINERISILENKGLDMTQAKLKLTETEEKIDEINTEAGTLADLVLTEITEENQAQILSEIKTKQDTIRTMARATHALLVDIIKEITKVLPNQTPTDITD